MKGIKLLFGILFTCVAFGGATADDDVAARAATRQNATGTSPSAASRAKQTATPDTASGTRAGGTFQAASRTTTAATKNATAPAAPARTISARTTTTPTESPRTTQSDTAAPRTQNVTTRPENKSVRARTATTTPRATTVRTATVPRINTDATRIATTAARSATPARPRVASSKTMARAATTGELRDAILNRDYSACRQVYYDCMDEFCANKDSQLKRCACSSRIHEFDRVKQQLDTFENKMLDFSQRLLTVNMDKEDAAAMNIATEGELAFNTKDRSDSKKILDEITKKLKANGNDSFNQSLTSISLSLNTDAAFDNVDSLMGAATTAKEGTDLYNAALPVCREMAMEVCDEDSLSLAASGYMMSIEQDCNIVAKTYSTQTDQARDKIREGGALLDISRLDIHQKRNSDNVLECKRKMLAQLSDTTVCGENLERCLDMSGQYIDPSTGQAFLTQNLANLSLLLTRPTGAQTWSSVPGNDKFVSYLYSKKKFLDTATENCQDIADTVWDEFIDDALAQIKLAQDKKLEEVRQSCTTLTAQCISNASDSLTEFDSRALSTFGIAADTTANAMCASVKNACTALMQYDASDAQNEWATGMTQIATEKTYETILQTCREVGRACIVRACTSISGNFGLCTDIQTSINRKSIINRTACWQEVLDCVASAGDETIDRIYAQNLVADNPKDFFNRMYNAEYKIINGWTSFENAPIRLYDLCYNECAPNQNHHTYRKYNELACEKCLIAEQIWGNCEFGEPKFIDDKYQNKIIIPNAPNSDTGTLLAWFAKNTGTETAYNSCVPPLVCPSGQVFKNGQCEPIPKVECDDGTTRMIIGFGTQICCSNANVISDGICLADGTLDAHQETTQQKGLPVFVQQNTGVNVQTYKIYITGKLAVPVAVFNTPDDKQLTLVCVSENTEKPVEFDDTGIHCDGRFIYVEDNDLYIDPHGKDSFLHFDEYGYTINGWGSIPSNSMVQGWYLTPPPPGP